MDDTLLTSGVQNVSSIVNDHTLDSGVNDWKRVCHKFESFKEVSRQTITGISLVVLAFRLFVVIWFLNKLPLAILHVQSWSVKLVSDVLGAC